MHACSFRDCVLEKNGVEEAGLKSIMLGGGTGDCACGSNGTARVERAGVG